ncbi:MAG: hypothetical protein J6V80_01045 [Clostridia bacterium]|nr:hypothetical protein [Clostridia bacterium]
MKYKELSLRANTPEAAVTEIMYEIAASRADVIELIRLDISQEGRDVGKILSSAIKLLKNMKQRGSIQFFATEDSFKRSSTEAVFLQNKYPDMFIGNFSAPDGVKFIYIKL